MKKQAIHLFWLCLIAVIASCYGLYAAMLDPEFGNDGRVAVELGIYGDRANAVVVQEDGRILVAGSSSNSSDLDFMLFRLLEDGSLDPDFNFDGTVTTAVGSYDDEILALVLQDDGKIIVVGYSSNGMDRDFALARYNEDGSMDRNFGMEGMVVTAVGNSDDEITDVVLTADGSILVTGSALGTTGRVILLVKYRADGTLDIDFGDDGFSLIGVGRDAQAESIGLTEDERIIVSGTYSEDDKRGLMIVGFTQDGQIDADFAENGIGVATENHAFSEGYGLAIREDGKILVAGSVGEEGMRDAALFQFTANGTPDSSFEEDGVLVTGTAEGDDLLYDVIETGTMIAASGYKTVGEGREFLFITYENSRVTIQDTPSGQAVDPDSLLRITQLQVEESFNEYQEEERDQHLVEVVSTEFNEGEDTSTALAAFSANSVVVVGVSSVNDISSAAVTKYTTETASQSVTITSTTDEFYILTGEPYDVTRTTAIIPVEILSGIGTVTDRGVVFSTMPNPIFKDGTDGSDSTDDADNDDTTDDTGEPVRSNLAPTGTVTTTSIDLSLTTDVNATCRYSDYSGVDYSSMTYEFDTTGGTSHSEAGTVADGYTYTYYVKCENVSTGEENTTDAEISFSVNIDDGEDDLTPPTITTTTSDSFLSTTVTLSITTDETATCKYNLDNDETYSSMTDFFSDTGDTSHLASLEDQASGDYTYYARCEDLTGNSNDTGTEISFTVAGITPPTVYTIPATFNPQQGTGLSSVVNKNSADRNWMDDEMNKVCSASMTSAVFSSAIQSVGSLFVATAMAADNDTTDTTDSEFLEEGSTSEGAGTGAFSTRLTNLKPGTFFYVRSYAVVNGTTRYGNQVGFRTADSCFVATAAFGSFLHPYVQILREFRDQFMFSNQAGRSLVSTYYRYSHPVADMIEESSALRFGARVLLLPLVGAAWLALQLGLTGLLFLLTVSGAFCWFALRPRFYSNA